MSNVWPKVEPSERGIERPMSVDEWLALDEDEPGELVDGQLVEEEVPDFTHELSVSWLIAMLGAWLGGSGFVAGSDSRSNAEGVRGVRAHERG